MKINKISRRAFLLGLGAVSTAALLSACGGSASSSSAASGSAVSGSAASAGSDVFRTLDEIKADGTVNIGVFSDKNPFGYVDENGEYQGYDVYFARRLAEDLGVEANFVSTEAANRIEYLQTGKVDIILANFTVTPERAEEVDFALPYMNVALGVISPDSNVITSLDNWNADRVRMTEFIDLAKRYTVPLTPVPKVINKFSKDIALYNLFSRAGLDPDGREGNYLTRYNAAVKFLALVAEGKVSIGSETSDPKTAAATGFALHSNDRIFSRETMKGM